MVARHAMVTNLPEETYDIMLMVRRLLAHYSCAISLLMAVLQPAARQPSRKSSRASTVISIQFDPRRAAAPRPPPSCTIFLP